MTSLSKILKKRTKIINKFQQKNPNYFKWNKYLDLEKYSTYITITPRGVGKTFSAIETAIEWYELTGEYTTWMRTTLEEVKNIVDNYKKDPPHPTIGIGNIKYEWQGHSIVDAESGRLVINFLALSTVHNMASITGNGCGLLIYDEFLPRTNRRLPRAYFKLADFIKTLERKNMMTVILQANATTLNSDILMHWDIWNDISEVRDESKRLWYTHFTEWENPPKVENVSTTTMWTNNTKELQDFIDKGTFLDGDGGMVLPESRIGSLRLMSQYKLDSESFTLAMTDDNMFCIVPGERMANAPVFVLTNKDGFEKGRYVRPIDIRMQLNPIKYALEADNLIFTTFELKESVFKYLDMLYGKIERLRD